MDIQISAAGVPRRGRGWRCGGEPTPDSEGAEEMQEDLWI
jgi:hypothetical protein